MNEQTAYYDLDSKMESLRDLLDRADEATTAAFDSALDLSWIYHDNALEGIVLSFHELKAAVDPRIISDSTLIPMYDEIGAHKASIDLIRELATRRRLGLDLNTTNFQFRWALPEMARKWGPQLGLEPGSAEYEAWLKALMDAVHPPLTADRTMGALGGIVASRIARAFRVGGPSFTVSGEETSGLKAMDIAVRSLQQHRTDIMLAGAVDMAGDVRNIILSHVLRPFAAGNTIKPFDMTAAGPLPGDGAACLVLKRLTTAKKAGDRIYAVIRGLGHACGNGINGQAGHETYVRSLERCFSEARIRPGALSYMETHGSGDPAEDRTEARALHAFFTRFKSPCAIGALTPVIGHTGAAAGLVDERRVLHRIKDGVQRILNRQHEAGG